MSPIPAAVCDLCRRFHVRRLDLFGSAVDGRFNPGRSDLDFLVAFEELPDRTYADAYFGLREALAGLFGREVDLLTEPALENPICAMRSRRSAGRSTRPHEVGPSRQIPLGRRRAMPAAFSRLADIPWPGSPMPALNACR